MRFRHVVFDPDLLLEAAPFLERAVPQGPSGELLQKAACGEVTGWIAAQSLARIEQGLRAAMDGEARSPAERDRAVAECLTWVCRHLRVLTLPGEECRQLIGRSARLDEAQIALAASALDDEACIATLKPDFETAGYAQAATPADILSGAAKPRKDRMGFIDLRAQQHDILPILEQRVRTVFRHGQFILGPEIRELERKLAEFAGVQHALTCASGTDALLLVLMALEVGPGDAVLTTPFTFIATAEVICLLGATPVFVDIDPATFNLDPQALDQALRALRARDPSVHPLPRGASSSPLRPKVVIPVDLFGLPADYDAIQEVADRHGVFVLEDAAQSFGAVYKGKKTCSLGQAAATSFFPAKPLGCYGDGGAVFTNDETLACTVASLRVHGQGSDKYENIRIGLNARCDTLQAAILLAKLEVLPQELDRRRQVAGQYTRALAHCPYLQTPRVPAGLQSAWAQYSVLSDHRSRILEVLKAAGIPAAVYYPKPLHLQTAFSGLGYLKGDFPVSEEAARRIFSLPMHPYLTDEQIQRIASAVASAAATASTL